MSRMIAAFALVALVPVAASALPVPLLDAFGAAATAADETKSTSENTPRVSVIKVGGQLREIPSHWAALGLDDATVFPELLDGIRAEARDKNVKALVVKLGASSMGFGQAQELAAAFEEARDAHKKPVIVHLTQPMTLSVLAAMGASEIHVTPHSTVLIPGLRAEVAFYKDLLGTLGISFDMEAVGKYKSAVEPMTRADMSAAARQALTALVDDLYNALVAGIARGRKLAPEAVQALIDTGLLSAEAAKDKGLIDATTPWGVLLEDVEKRYAKPELRFPRVEDAPNLGSMFGLMALFNAKPADDGGTEPRVAVLRLEGPIVMGSAPLDFFDPSNTIASSDVVHTLQDIAADERVKALVVRIDSPGGSALASEVIWQELERFNTKRPVVVSMGNVAASGGYYIASAARRVFAQPTTLTGSIGVFGGKLVLKELYDKIGVHTVVVGRGKNSGLFSTLTRFGEDERKVLRGMMQRTYDTFVNRVAAGRRMSYDAVHEVAQGRVWTGRQALDVGLVDALGGTEEAVAAAAKLAKLDRKKVKVVGFPKARSLMELLGGPDKQRLRLAAPAWWQALPAELAKQARYVATTLELLTKRELTLTMLPYVLSVR